MDFLIGLGKEWSKLGLKGLPSKPYRSLVSQCSSCSLQPEVPENDGWKDIVHPTVSQHRGWPNLSLSAPPSINQIFQDTPVHSPIQSSHARKRLKMEAHHAPEK
jgi:hypothetical protein